jgi:hypothetical protein
VPSPKTRGIIAREYTFLSVCADSHRSSHVKGLTCGASGAKMVRSVRADRLILPEPFDR